MHSFRIFRYRLSPFTYLIEGLLGQCLSLSLDDYVLFTRCFAAVGLQQINCSPVEFVNIIPPSGQTCAQYMSTFISSSGGYLANPNATSSCQFCGVRTTDELLGANFNIFYDHHWRDFGLMIAFILFNVRSFLHELFFRWLTSLDILHFCSDISVPHPYWEPHGDGGIGIRNRG